MIGGIGGAGPYQHQMQTEAIMPQKSGPGGTGGPPPGGGLLNDMDSDSSGGISQSEFEILAEGITAVTGAEVNAEEALTTFDTDGDGELNGEELFQAMTANGVQPPPPPSPHMAMEGGNNLGDYQPQIGPRGGGCICCPSPTPFILSGSKENGHL